VGYPIEYFLPGAFASNPTAGVVNGSLWTLPVEMEMYLGVAALGVLGLFAAREWFNTFFAAFILVVSTVKISDFPLVYGTSPEVPRMVDRVSIRRIFLCQPRPRRDQPSLVDASVRGDRSLA
jgi:peptidoglycan/LPS O-acetylase OafA/YrhL